MAALTTVEALRQDLQHFEFLDDFAQEAVADYFACPNSPDCKLDDLNDGTDKSICPACKVRWLLSKWED